MPSPQDLLIEQTRRQANSSLFANTAQFDKHFLDQEIGRFYFDQFCTKKYSICKVLKKLPILHQNAFNFLKK